MKRILIALFLIINFEINSAPLINAGILPYTYDKSGNAYFLIGKEPNGLWADFGGNFEKTDFSPRYTAAREFSEETRYVFGKFAAKIVPLEAKVDKSYLQKSINYITPRIRKELAHPQGYYKMFLAKVDFIPADVFNNAATVPHYEKREYAWVPVVEFMDAMLKARDRLHAFYHKKQMRRQIYDILYAEYDTIMKTIHPLKPKKSRKPRRHNLVKRETTL